MNANASDHVYALNAFTIQWLHFFLLPFGFTLSLQSVGYSPFLYNKYVNQLFHFHNGPSNHISLARLKNLFSIFLVRFSGFSSTKLYFSSLFYKMCGFLSKNVIFTFNLQLKHSLQPNIIIVLSIVFLFFNKNCLFCYLCRCMTQASGNRFYYFL